MEYRVESANSLMLRSYHEIEWILGIETGNICLVNVASV